MKLQLQCETRLVISKMADMNTKRLPEEIRGGGRGECQAGACLVGVIFMGERSKGKQDVH